MENNQTPCCAKTQCCPGAPADGVTQASSEITFSDRVAHIRCRLSSYRMKARVKPGLYAVGSPGRSADVFVTANYRLSFDALRGALKGLDAWVLVLDTKGINVWCAAGKGTFGTEELARRIFETDLAYRVDHRKIIVPQLGAVGVNGREVERITGFKVLWGPVRAADIKDYLNAGRKADRKMRTVEFTFKDRLVLTPIELSAALKWFPVYALIVSLFFGLGPKGIIFGDALSGGLPYLWLGLLAIASGALLTPAFLQYVPSRSFAIKGLLAGLATTLLAFGVSDGLSQSHLTLKAFSILFYPALSSFLALQFTGATTYTSMTGVRKELKYAMPAYIAVGVVSVMLAIGFKLYTWGVL